MGDSDEVKKRRYNMFEIFFKLKKLIIISSALLVNLTAYLFTYNFILQPEWNNEYGSELCTTDMINLCKLGGFKTWSGSSSCGAESKYKSGFQRCHELTKETCEEKDNYCFLEFCSKFDNPMICLNHNYDTLKSFKNINEATSFCDKSFKDHENYGKECFENIWETYDIKFQNCENINNKILNNLCFSFLEERQRIDTF